MLKHSFVTHLESAVDGTPRPARRIQTMHAGRPLWVRYDLEAVKRAVSREDLLGRPRTLWRYRELLPFERPEHIVSLGETMTPLLRCDRLAAAIGMKSLLIKDESRLPGGTFKARGMALAVTMANELGIQRVVTPTAGNAGGSLAAYAARAGMDAYILMPEDTPLVNRLEAALHGARTYLVNGLINDCARIARDGAGPMGWFEMSGLREPYRIEGKKTMGLELAEQMGWQLPDVILYPTGGGTGLIGMWKAFEELAAIGWLENHIPPRLFACQSSGCSPIVDAFDRGDRFATPPAQPHTIASGLRVPAPIGDFMILDAVRASSGRAMAADEDRLLDRIRLAAEDEGIALCPEAAVCLDVLIRGLDEGIIGPEQSVVLYNTGSALKYIEAIDIDLPRLDHTAAIDWGKL